MESRRWPDEEKHHSVVEIARDLPEEARKVSEFIFKGLIGRDGLSLQPIELRNPFAFYWGHISSFSDRKSLELQGRSEERERFERGVDPDVDDPTKCHTHSTRIQAWPTVEELERYANDVEVGLRDKIAREGVSRDILLSLEHAEMHHETLLYMVMQMDQRCKTKIPVHPLSEFQSSPTAKRADSSNGFVRIESTVVNLGATSEEVAASGFVWDNELPSNKCEVEAFACAACPITNSEFNKFVEDGGYKSRSFWEDNPINKIFVQKGGLCSWSWINREEINHPLFWQEHNGEFGVRTLSDGVITFGKGGGSGDWPVIVSLFEAAAFCAWRGNGARVMAETEYHALFSGSDDFNNCARRGNNNWRYQGVVPVGFMGDESSKGVYDLVGNGWEWTSTAFGGFNGFEAQHDYPEYSADFFDGKHFVMKGASPFTGTLCQRLSFRNWYQPNYPYPIAKFRIVC